MRAGPGCRGARACAAASSRASVSRRGVPRAASSARVRTAQGWRGARPGRACGGEREAAARRWSGQARSARRRAGEVGHAGAGSGRPEQHSGNERKERGGKKRKEKKKMEKGKRKRKGGRGRKTEIRGEPFGGDHDAGWARAAVAYACRGFGGKWRARIEGNRGTEWRLDPGVGTGKKISGVRV